MKNTLIGKDSNGRIRVVIIELEQLLDKTYIIKRKSGRYGGKFVEHQVIKIKTPKQKRTLQQQAELQYNSYISGYKDKGYIDSTIDINNAIEEELRDKLPEFKTDNNGNKKPMFAKVISDLKNFKKGQDKYYISTKLDGVRCMIFKKDGKIISASRGGKSYDLAISHIFEDNVIKRIFLEYPNIILDGELYIHGYSLQKISGLCRTENNPNLTSVLQYHIYDIGDPKLTFSERLSLLKNIKNKYQIPSVDSKICIIDHILVDDLDKAKYLSSEFVKQGYEGGVIRHEKGYYKFGARSSEMFKIKEYQEDEFKIIGINLNNRDEDMTFICETKEGLQFNAKPIGCKDLKKEYIKNFENIKNKMGTVKFFGYSDDNIPTQPVFKCVRDYE